MVKVAEPDSICSRVKPAEMPEYVRTPADGIKPTPPKNIVGVVAEPIEASIVILM
jgi:hypothetical protein